MIFSTYVILSITISGLGREFSWIGLINNVPKHTMSWVSHSVVDFEIFYFSLYLHILRVDKWT